MSKDSADLDFIMRVFRVTAFDNCGDIWWRTDDKYAPLTIFVNCNDVFYWAMADCEEITPDNIDVFEQAYKDAAAAENDEYPSHGNDLFAARVRKMRPQPPCYKYYREKGGDKLVALFDACGPERDPKECG